MLPDIFYVNQKVIHVMFDQCTEQLCIKVSLVNEVFGKLCKQPMGLKKSPYLKNKNTSRHKGIAIQTCIHTW